jgi:hypothetical protein
MMTWDGYVIADDAADEKTISNAPLVFINSF